MRSTAAHLVNKFISLRSFSSSRMTFAFTVHKAIHELAHQYDGFILDQYGVMHNGKDPLPGAVECVEKLHALNKKLIILSNTSSPAQNALEKLPKLGFNPDHFKGAVTSGEEASRFIYETYGKEKTISPDSTTAATKAIFLTWADVMNSNTFIENCKNVIEPTSNFKEAELVIAHGSQIFRNGDEVNSNDLSLGSFMEDGDLSLIVPILEKCREYHLPMICANPDFIVKVGDGSIAHMPGKIVQKYQEMGGTCTSFGKPAEEHFNACLRELELDACRVVHVGDSLHHDIRGANAAGISSIFIMGGIHGDELGVGAGVIVDNDDFDDHDPSKELMLLPSHKELQTFFGTAGKGEEGKSVPIIPTHVTPFFKF